MKYTHTRLLGQSTYKKGFALDKFSPCGYFVRYDYVTYIAISELFPKTLNLFFILVISFL